jgi:pimeloyl-ACP methyl ester carboxylesterase
VTLIAGDLSDPAFAKGAAYLKRLFPRARSVCLPGAAHMLHIDQPELWIQALASA